jgi:hypothetical protein
VSGSVFERFICLFPEGSKEGEDVEIGGFDAS